MNRIQTSCDPKFEWTSEQKKLIDQQLKRLVVERYGRVTPLSREPFFMTVSAHGNGLDALYIFHQGINKDPDPIMRQLLPSGIEARALNPFSIIRVVAFVKEENNVKIDNPDFYCIK